MVRQRIELENTDPRPVVVVTGGARRVGATSAQVFHRAGFDVVVHYRNSADEARRLVATLNNERADSAIALASTLADTGAIERFATEATQAFGRVDVLINNASSFFPTPWGEIEPDGMAKLLHSNLQLPLLLIQALAGELRKRRGCIVNMVDIHALRPLAHHAVYNAAKAGLISLTRSAALDLAPDIRANAIAPGAILLPEHEGADHERRLLEQIPLARMGSPEDIAGAALYLATAPYVTGQVLAVDGGRSLRQ